MEGLSGKEKVHSFHVCLGDESNTIASLILSYLVIGLLHEFVKSNFIIVMRTEARLDQREGSVVRGGVL